MCNDTIRKVTPVGMGAMFKIGPKNTFYNSRARLSPEGEKAGERVPPACEWTIPVFGYASST